MFARHRRTADLLPAALYLVPAVGILAVFVAFPIASSAYLSLHEWDGLRPQRPFVGLANYQRLFASREFWNSAWVTSYYTVGVTLLSLALGLLLAVALNRGLRLLSFYRAVYFLPVITSMVAAGVVWTSLFDPVQGMINVGLRALGLPGPPWLNHPAWSMPALIVVGAWKRIGFTMVLYLAGLQAIPRDYYDAAAVDGAGWWARLRRITLPLLAPITVLLVIMSVIDAVQVFDLAYVMTQGGPLSSTEVLGLYLYRQGFTFFKMGYAAAVGWVMFAVVLAVTVIQWRLFGFGSRGAA